MTLDDVRQTTSRYLVYTVQVVTVLDHTLWDSSSLIEAFLRRVNRYVSNDGLPDELRYPRPQPRNMLPTYGTSSGASIAGSNPWIGSARPSMVSPASVRSVLCQAPYMTQSSTWNRTWGWMYSTYIHTHLCICMTCRLESRPRSRSTPVGML